VSITLRRPRSKLTDRCNPRPDADAPPEPSVAGAEVPPVQTEIAPGTGVGRLGRDFWELALRLSMQNPPFAALARMLADTPVPAGFDFATIVRWTQEQLAPLLWARTEDQEMFLDIVRQQPNVIQSLFIQSQGDPRALAQGVEMIMMQARLQQRQRQNVRRARTAAQAAVQAAQVNPAGAATPVQDVTTAMRAEVAAAVRQQTEADRTRRDPRVRTTTGDTIRPGRASPIRIPQPAANAGWITEIPAFRPPPPPAAAPPPPADNPVPAGRLPVFNPAVQAAAAGAIRPDRAGRTFSLTDVWRNMAQRNNTNNTNNNNNNTDANNNQRR